MGVYLSVEDVRLFLVDRGIHDNRNNPLNADLEFTDKEVDAAMQRAAREYNSVPPIDMQINPGRLPNNDNMFLYGVVAQLLASRIMQLGKELINYAEGSGSVSPVRDRLEFYQAKKDEFTEQFITLASQQKLTRASNMIFGSVG